MKPERIIFPQDRYENDPNEREKEVIDEVRKKLEERQEATRAFLHTIAEDPTPEAAAEKEKALEEVREELTSYFGECDLTPHLPKNEDVIDVMRSTDIFLPHNKERLHIDTISEFESRDQVAPMFIRSGVGGERIQDIIWRKEIQGSMDRTEDSFKKINKDVSMAHETYHLTAPSIFYLRSSADGGTEAEEHRIGLSYHKIPKTDNSRDVYMGGGILEEGMAVLFQDRFLNARVLPKLEPAEQEYIKATRQNVAAQSGWPIESVVLTISAEDRVNGTVNAWENYSTSVHITKILKERIEKNGQNFNKLVENARLNNKTISLAKAIENVTEKGMYRKICECPSVQEAENILIALKIDGPESNG